MKVHHTYKYDGKRYADRVQLNKALRKEYGEGTVILHTVGAVIVTTAKGQVIRLQVTDHPDRKTLVVGKFSS